MTCLFSLFCFLPLVFQSGVCQDSNELPATSEVVPVWNLKRDENLKLTLNRKIALTSLVNNDQLGNTIEYQSTISWKVLGEVKDGFEIQQMISSVLVTCETQGQKFVFDSNQSESESKNELGPLSKFPEFLNSIVGKEAKLFLSKQGRLDKIDIAGKPLKKGEAKSNAKELQNPLANATDQFLRQSINQILKQMMLPLDNLVQQSNSATDIQREGQANNGNSPILKFEFPSGLDPEGNFEFSIFKSTETSPGLFELQLRPKLTLSEKFLKDRKLEMGAQRGSCTMVFNLTEGIQTSASLNHKMEFVSRESGQATIRYLETTTELGISRVGSGTD